MNQRWWQHWCLFGLSIFGPLILKNGTGISGLGGKGKDNSWKSEGEVTSEDEEKGRRQENLANMITLAVVRGGSPAAAHLERINKLENLTRNERKEGVG